MNEKLEYSLKKQKNLVRILTPISIFVAFLGAVAIVFWATSNTHKAEISEARANSISRHLQKSDRQKQQLFQEKQQSLSKESDYFAQAEQAKAKAVQLEKDIRQLSREIILDGKSKELIKKIPIATIVSLGATSIKSADSENHFQFTIWLNGIDAVPFAIKEVRYYFAQQSVKQKPEISKSSEDGFKVQHVANGCLSELLIDIIPKEGNAVRVKKNLCEALGWDSVSEIVHVKHIKIYHYGRDDCLEPSIDEALTTAKKKGYKPYYFSVITNVSKPEVRYFHEEDAELAATISDSINTGLRHAGIKKVSPVAVGERFKGQPFGLFEIWLPLLGYCKQDLAEQISPQE